MKKNIKNHGFPRCFIGFSGVIAVVIALVILFVWIVPCRTTTKEPLSDAVSGSLSGYVSTLDIPDNPVYYSTTMRGASVGYEIKTWKWQKSAKETGTSPKRESQTLEVASQSCLKMRRGGQITVLRLSEKQVMTADKTGRRWKVDSFETTLQAGGQTQSVYGVIQNKQLKIYENNQIARTMTISDNFHGVLYLDHLHLEGKLPRPGQTVEIQAIVGSVAADLLVRSDEAVIHTVPNSPQFNKISVFSKNNESDSPSAVPLEIVWNPGYWPHAILELPGLQVRNVPVSTADPIAAAQFPIQFETIPDDQLFDLNAAMLIPVDKPVDPKASVNRFLLPLSPNALPTDDYQISQKAEEQENEEHKKSGQDARAPGRSLVTISIVPETRSSAKLPTPETREPSPLVNFGDPRVQRLLTPDSGFPANPIDSPEKLKAAERFVSIYIKEKIYCDALADAASVVDSRRGDCTEHACLMAALLRGRNVPCRMAVGLVYVPQSQSFGFHVWNEAWLDPERRWIPLDAALQGFAADHIKIAETSFDAPSLNAAMTTLYNYMAQIEFIVNAMETRTK